MFEYYTHTTTRPTCRMRRRIVRKKKKDNVFYSKFYFEIKIDTLMIGARKCQVNQVGLFL